VSWRALSAQRGVLARQHVLHLGGRLLGGFEDPRDAIAERPV